MGIFAESSVVSILNSTIINTVNTNTRYPVFLYAISGDTLTIDGV